MKAAITLQDLGVRLGGRPILHGLTADLSGRALGLLGPNGAGKTTLIHTLLGFHAPSSGGAEVLGHDIADRHAARRLRALIGYMPERDAFIGDQSAIRQVRLFAEMSGLPSRVALERSHEALIAVGLGEARYRQLRTYSMGMKQRVKLAQAIVHGPRLLFLDEPTNGMDPAGRARMIHLVREIRDSGVTIVLSSHLLHDVEQCCEEVLILKDGRIARHCDLAAERQTNRSFLDLEVRGDREAFAAAAAAMGSRVALQGRTRLKLIAPPEVTVRDLYAAAAEHGVRIRRLGHRRDSLEDIFLAAMGLTTEATPVTPDGPREDVDAQAPIAEHRAAEEVEPSGARSGSTAQGGER